MLCLIGGEDALNCLFQKGIGQAGKPNRSATALKKSLLSIAPDESDVFLCIGTGSVFFGVYQLNPPLAFILIGLEFIGLAFLQAKAGN